MFRNYVMAFTFTDFFICLFLFCFYLYFFLINLIVFYKEFYIQPNSFVAKYILKTFRILNSQLPKLLGFTNLLFYRNEYVRLNLCPLEQIFIWIFLFLFLYCFAFCWIILDGDIKNDYELFMWPKKELQKKSE